jgi:hypothetical protein
LKWPPVSLITSFSRSRPGFTAAFNRSFT